MSSFLLDADGDLDTTSNQISLTSGADAVRQHLWEKFRIFLGEWSFDLTIGFPWYRDILIKKPSFVVVQAVTKDYILKTPGILEMTDFGFDYNPATRVADLDFKALTDEGEIDFSELIDV